MGRFAKWGLKMASKFVRLSAPTQNLFLVSLVLAILALLGGLVVIPVISVYAFWIAIIAYIVLAIGCVMKGM